MTAAESSRIARLKERVAVSLLIALAKQQTLNKNTWSYIKESSIQMADEFVNDLTKRVLS